MAAAAGSEAGVLSVWHLLCSGPILFWAFLFSEPCGLATRLDLFAFVWVLMSWATEKGLSRPPPGRLSHNTGPRLLAPSVCGSAGVTTKVTDLLLRRRSRGEQSWLPPLGLATATATLLRKSHMDTSWL